MNQGNSTSVLAAGHDAFAEPDSVTPSWSETTAGGDPMSFTESTVRLTTADGRVGCGNLERSNRRSSARPPRNA